MDNTKSILYLVPYEYYLLAPSAPFWPFILPIVNFVVAIVRTYSRLPARFTTKLFLRFLYLHIFVNTGKLLFLHTRIGCKLVFWLMFYFLDQFAVYDLISPHFSHLPTTSNRGEFLNMVAWGVFEIGALCTTSMLVHWLTGWYYHYQVSFPASFRNVRWIILFIALICMLLKNFIRFETYFCIDELNKQPFVTSCYHMDVVNSALVDAGWKYPVHAFVNFHVKYMNMIWAFLGLSI